VPAPSPTSPSSSSSPSPSSSTSSPLASSSSSSSPCPPSLAAAIALAAYARKYTGVPSSVHVTLGADPSSLDAEALATSLDGAKAAGVRNIVLEWGGGGAAQAASPLETEAAALLRGPGPPGAALHLPGDPPAPSSLPAPSPFPSSPFLPTLRALRLRHGDHFCVGLVGDPSATPATAAAHSPPGLAACLRERLADFVLVRPTLDADAFRRFRDAVVALTGGGAGAGGSGAPPVLIPTVVPIPPSPAGVAAWRQVLAFCRVPVPPALDAELDAAAGLDAGGALEAVATRATAALCRDLLALRLPVPLHIATLNLDGGVMPALRALGLSGPDAASRRKLPWRPAVDETRAAEEIRPIFWANRPAAYVERTAHWREFPAGRWKTAREEGWSAGGGGWGEPAASTPTGAAAAAAAAAAANTAAPPPPHTPFTPLSETQLVPPGAGTPEQRRALWGANPTDDKHIWAVFAGYMSGRVPRLPWCEKALLPETSLIAAQLVRLNREGFLTINSQPRVHGARSDDPTFGWGGPGGLVYQKAYVECFCAPGHLAALVEASQAHPSVSFTALDAAGTTLSSRRLDCAAALTWGVFPDREVQQPTIVEHTAFVAWKAEAFALWRAQWGSIYEEGSEAADLLARIHDEYFLVNVVDNDFVGGDVFSVFEDALRIRKEKGDRLPTRVAEGLRKGGGGGGGGGSAQAARPVLVLEAAPLPPPAGGAAEDGV
jgi:methylenetetrahydrofolate reductase (NADPH)